MYVIGDFCQINCRQLVWQINFDVIWKHWLKNRKVPRVKRNKAATVALAACVDGVGLASERKKKIRKKLFLSGFSLPFFVDRYRQLRKNLFPFLSRSHSLPFSKSHFWKSQNFPPPHTRWHCCRFLPTFPQSLSFETRQRHLIGIVLPN